MTQKTFLSTIRKNKGMERAVLHKIEVDREERLCTFEVITDLPYTQADERAVQTAAAAAVPQPFEGEARICKLVTDPQLVSRKIVEYFEHFHRAAAACIHEEDIEVELGNPVVFSFGVDKAEREFFEKNGTILSDVKKMLERNFCDTFEGELFYKKKVVQQSDADLDEDDEPFDYRPPRTFPIEEYKAIDGDCDADRAIYIEDCDISEMSLTVCGEIIFLQERNTKPKTDENGEVVKKSRTYLRLTINDGTAPLSFSYFPKKRTEEKILALKEGDWIVCTGENELFEGQLSFRARQINLGHPPKDFVPEKRPSKALPLHYSLVFPEEFIDYNQLSLFEKADLPDDLKNNTFVVFDLETTGLVNTPSSGTKMDAITEIGAVKIIDGEVREKFTTLVNPERKLEEKIVEITGITDEMLADAPKISEVLPDFLKFCEGCLLVGHNVMFDYKFVRYYAEKDEYSFEYQTYDTLTLAQSLLFLRDYKLNTLADYYGIVFQHHRAWADALTTAKIFIELIKAKKCLPKA